MLGLVADCDTLALERASLIPRRKGQHTYRDEAEQVDFPHDILPRCPVLLLCDCPSIMEFKYKIAFSLGVWSFLKASMTHRA